MLSVLNVNFLNLTLKGKSQILQDATLFKIVRRWREIPFLNPFKSISINSGEMREKEEVSLLALRLQFIN